MDILLTNDDGIYADGLWCLYQAFADHYNVGVVAPDRERSAVGHAITLNEPLRLRQVTVRNGYSGTAVTGTPVDCVKLGLLKVSAHFPRLVISGINPGANVGVNVNYSGTVAAAREAALFGINALAVSINSRHPDHLKDAVCFVQQLVVQVLSKGMPKGTFLNVNIPDLPLAEMAGVRCLRHGTQFNGECFEKRVDPRNRAYYWHGGDMQTRGNQKNTIDSGASPVSPDGRPDRDGYQDQVVDAVYLNRQYITITPVTCDTTDYEALKTMQHWALNID